MGKVMYMRKGDIHTAPVAPVKGIPASDLAVGNSVFLNFNGKLTEFLVVNQGIPSNSSLYDASCNGTWLLMKDIYEKHTAGYIWEDERLGYPDYPASSFQTYLNDTVLNRFDDNVAAHIKTIKIPYSTNKYTTNYNKVYSGSSGLSTKIFLLSGIEVGWTEYNSSGIRVRPLDGACLSYFSGTADTDSKRIAKLQGTATSWYLRSPGVNARDYNCSVSKDGGPKLTSPSDSTNGKIRFALILPSNTLFDPDTMEFVGVA